MTAAVLMGAIAATAAVACGGGESPTQPAPGPGAGSPTLTAPAHDSPADDAETNALQPVLRVVNATSTQTGSKTYEFQVSSAADFGGVAAGAQNVPEGTDGKTAWTVGQPLEPNTRYWWRARAVQGSTTGPWSTATRFRSRREGYNRAGELFDPLTNGNSVGAPVNVSFVEQGVRLDSLTSRVTYALVQTLSEGEFSLMATGLNNASAGETTKLFSMQQGFSDITTNPYRATVEKRANGTVSFRLIGGNPDTRADADRRVVQFNATATYFWKFTWGNGTARLRISEDDEAGRVLFDNTKTYGGTYRPSPHIAHLGAPPGRGGVVDASVPGAIIRNVWISSRPRPTALGGDGF